MIYRLLLKVYLFGTENCGKIYAAIDEVSNKNLAFNTLSEISLTQDNRKIVAVQAHVFFDHMPDDKQCAEYGEKFLRMTEPQFKLLIDNLTTTRINYGII